MVSARHATSRDLAAVEALCELESHILEKHWGPHSLGRLMERSALSCCTMDDSGALVGFATFHHFPALGDLPAASYLDDVAAMCQCDDLDDWEASKTISLTFFHSEHMHEEEGLREVLKMALNYFPDVERVLLLLPANVPLFKPLLGNFEPIPARSNTDADAMNVQVFHTTRVDNMGEMAVRIAIVEDHDDLTPIFKAQTPDADEYGEFFLAQMIQAQDSNNKALVAEVNGRAVGLLSLTADVELSALQDTFELEPYDWLVQGYAEEAVRVHDTHVARVARLRAQHADELAKVKAEARAQVEQLFAQEWQEYLDSQEQENADANLTEEQKAEEEAKRKALEEEELAKQVAQAEADAELEVGEFEEETEPAVDMASLEVNAVCLTLFCLDPAFDSQVHRVLQAALDKFPDKEYCIMTVAHTAAHSSIMRLMQPIRQQRGKTFSHALYLCHRASLITPRIVSRASPGDAGDVAEFLEGEPEAHSYAAALADPATAQHVMILKVLGQIAGVARATGCAEPEVFAKYYQLETFMQPAHYSRDEHIQVDGLVVNPIFYRAVPEMLRQIQLLTGACCTYCTLGVGTHVADALHCLTVVPVRRQEPSAPPADINPATTALVPNYSRPEGPPVLLHTNWRLLCQPKKDVDARVVVVGASDTAMGLLDSLLAVPYLSLHRVALISPGGLPTQAPKYRHDKLSFSEAEMLRHYPRGRCEIIGGSLEALDRQRQMVLVREDPDNQGQEGGLLELYYDYLVVAPGLIDTTRDKLLGLNAPVEGLFSARNLHEEQALDAWVKAQAPAAHTCVYGTDVDVLIAVQRLLTLGVGAECITVLCPAAEFQPLPDAKACKLALMALHNEGVKTKTNCKLASVEARHHKLRAVVLEDGSSVACATLVTLGELGVDSQLFKALNDESLVFDGRLVVDASFKTNDPAVFAGGDLVKFARRIQDKRKLDLYNLRELGDKLAEALLVELDPDAAAQGRAHALKVPSLVMPLGTAGLLPGGLRYCLMHASPALYPKGTRAGNALRDLTTETLSPLSYTRIEIDTYGRVSELCCVSEREIPDAWTLAGLIGIPVTYLNDVVSRTDLGLVVDLLDFLRQDWSRALLHDRFQHLRRQVERAAQTSEHMAALVSTLWAKVNAEDASTAQIGMSDTALAGDARFLVQDALNCFLEVNSDHLQGYLTAQRAEEMQVNNVWAHTAEKVGLVIGDVPLMDNSMSKC